MNLLKEDGSPSENTGLMSNQPVSDHKRGAFARTNYTDEKGMEIVSENDFAEMTMEVMDATVSVYLVTTADSDQQQLPQQHKQQKQQQQDSTALQQRQQQKQQQDDSIHQQHHQQPNHQQQQLEDPEGDDPPKDKAQYKKFKLTIPSDTPGIQRKTISLLNINFSDPPGKKKEQSTTVKTRLWNEQPETGFWNEEETEQPTGQDETIIHKCRVCGRILKTSIHLRVHMRLHNEENPFGEKRRDVRYGCDWCFRDFASVLECERHMRTHEGESGQDEDMAGESSQDSVMDMDSETYGEILHIDPRHPYNNTYPQESPTRTWFVPRPSSSESAPAKSPRPSVAPQKPRPYICHVCGRSCFDSSSLKKHVFRHTGLKPYECSQCDKTFSDISNLRSHEMTHSEERPHICEICGYGFLSNNRLKSHMRTHSDVKPFKCPLCGKSFTTKYVMYAHRRRHMTERPYKCDICQKSLSCTKTLREHKRLHTGEHPYLCHICGETFTTNVRLMNHVTLHTNELPFTCEHCGSRFRYYSTYYRHKKRTHAKGKEK